MISKLLTLSVVTMLFLSACDDAPEAVNHDIDRTAIVASREAQRDAHFAKDAETFVSHISDDFISVNRGEVRSSTREENIERFQNYFDAVEFKKWDDIGDPVIRFSDDGTLAYVVTEKQVDLTYEGTEDETYLDKTKYAWVAIYRKTDAGWKVECIASTNREPENELLE